EPSPQHPEDEPIDAQRPNAIENVMAAALTLPRYETIREDLQQVLEHNRVVQRIADILRGLELDDRRARKGDEACFAPEAWGGMDLAARQLAAQNEPF